MVFLEVMGSLLPCFIQSRCRAPARARRAASLLRPLDLFLDLLDGQGLRQSLPRKCERPHTIPAAPGALLDPNVDGSVVETWRTRHGTHSDRSSRHEGPAPALHPRL